MVEGQGVEKGQIFFVQETPFSSALKICYEIGVMEAREWTYCIDADVILRKGALNCLLAHAEKYPKSYCVFNGQNYDKFLNKIRSVGNRLYKTRCLSNLIQRIPQDKYCIRPEASAIRGVRTIGLKSATAPILMGLHDFEQYNEHIFRKCFVHAYKHKDDVRKVLGYWRRKAVSDQDFFTAQVGYAAGLQYEGDISPDSDASYYRDAWNYSNLPEKKPLVNGLVTSECVEEMLKVKVNSPLWKLMCLNRHFRSGIKRRLGKLV